MAAFNGCDRWLWLMAVMAAVLGGDVDDYCGSWLLMMGFMAVESRCVDQKVGTLKLGW